MIRIAGLSSLKIGIGPGAQAKEEVREVMKMRVFMLGWEFPPHISGGLGTACFGLTKALDELGVRVSFVMPQAIPLGASSHVQFRNPFGSTAKVAGKGRSAEKSFQNVEIQRVSAQFQAYATVGGSASIANRESSSERTSFARPSRALGNILAHRKAFAEGGTVGYGGNLMTQVRRYSGLAVELADGECFDVIHAHDWMTYPAGLAVAAHTGKPLVVHVHSTEFDRSGEHVNRQVCDIERAGIHGADRVICVSNFTRGILLRRYAAPAERVEVVYNGVNLPSNDGFAAPNIARDQKLVLFLGRITMQKGPEYFLQAAKKVLEKFNKVRFVMAGNGDLAARSVELAAELGIGQHVTFTGFLPNEDVNRLLGMADLYVMPSVSEPFGIAPLEALCHGVPVIISKQAGVAEVLKNALKVDFWDIRQMADKMIAVLTRGPLKQLLGENGAAEVRNFKWATAARRCLEIYRSVASRDLEPLSTGDFFYRDFDSAPAGMLSGVN